ncbi:hypothetical protein CPHO_12115 [Corynebacterium phocae]|uniref:Uncharacterized protein n=1 Tax=Corynebacterium phocae TaxID=161895 RepID=A0A1L7D6E1_9CORY|nr:hypothetical protein [Corynebacterium phocae]APT93512.1 hypothetical protein CPHO_12115 [Corynebacterium phocae]KAA8720592.1 hypothetical protein F4V58_11555 [Corynebacterium phocae]
MNDQDPFAILKSALSASNPQPLLDIAATFIGMMEEDPGMAPKFIEGLISAERRENVAVLYVLKELTNNDILAKRIDKALKKNTHQLPKWLPQLGEMKVLDTAIEAKQCVGDVHYYAAEIDIPGAPLVTANLSINLNVGGTVFDFFIAPGDLSYVLEELKKDETIQSIDSISLGKLARAYKETSLAEERLPNQVYRETWPNGRPIFDWIQRHLPEPEPAEDTQSKLGDTAALAQEFIEELKLDDDDALRAEGLIFVSKSLGCGDPLRWSPLRVEIIFNAYSSNLSASEIVEDGIPSILRKLIVWAGKRNNTPNEFVELALEAVDEEQAKLLMKGFSREDSNFSPMDSGRIFEEFLQDAIDAPYEKPSPTVYLSGKVDDHPLPDDESVDMSTVPDDLKEKVKDCLEQIDKFFEGKFFEDLETKTVATRLLSRTLETNPGFIKDNRSSAARKAGVLLTVALEFDDRFDPCEIVEESLELRTSLEKKVETFSKKFLADKEYLEENAARFLTSSRRALFNARGY